MENTGKRTDRRVIKTKRAIRNAFAQLVSTKDINDITIKDIADTADINRKTFYNYYSGVYQIVDEIEDEITTAFNAVLQDIDFTDVLRDPQIVFARLTAEISRDLEFYSHLFKNGNNTGLSGKIISALRDNLKDTFGRQIAVDPVQLDLIADYSVSGLVAVYRKWFSSGHEIPISTLSSWVSRLTFAGINGFLESEGRVPAE